MVLSSFSFKPCLLATSLLQQVCPLPRPTAQGQAQAGSAVRQLLLLQLLLRCCPSSLSDTATGHSSVQKPLWALLYLNNPAPSSPPST